MNPTERTQILKSRLAERILVMDGAMGTAIQSLDLGPEDFGSPELEGCNEYLNITLPSASRGDIGVMNTGKSREKSRYAAEE